MASRFESSLSRGYPRYRKQNGVALRWLAGSVLFLVMLTAALGISWLATYELGVGVTLGAAILAFLPIPIFAGLILWLDRIEGEPPILVLAAFAWGATVAVLTGYICNTLFNVVVTAGTGNAVFGDVGSMILSAPIVEEFAKAGILFLLLFAKRELNGPLDGLVYGGMSGLGFAMSENIFYYGRAMHEGFAEAGALFILRGFFFALSHPMFTTFTGIGVALSVRAQSAFGSIFWLGSGLACAMAAHFFWNQQVAFRRQNALGMLVLEMAVGVGFLLLVAAITLFMESGVLRQRLAREREAGILNDETYKWATSLWRRLIPFYKLAYPAANRPILKRFMRVSVELAFSRERSLHVQGEELEEEISFQQELEVELRLLAPRV